MTSDEVAAAVTRERDRLLAAVDALGDRATTAPTTPEGWTAKDVLAHCIHWAGQIAFGLGAPLQPPPYLRAVSGRPSADEWNALAVAHVRDASLDDVRSQFEEVTQFILDAIRQRTDEDMDATDTLPYAGNAPLHQKIGGETFLHWPGHSADLERAAAAQD